MIGEQLLTRLTRIPGARSLWLRFPFGSVATRVQHGVFDRPHYAYCVYAAADLARRLGIPEISVIEFGVAGGRGLLALERIAKLVSGALGVVIHVTGFDSGSGMAPAQDYRDLPHVWGSGFYKMDLPKLKSALSPETELILGDIRDTIPEWSPRGPIGFVAFDLDYYSSTKAAFHLFDGDARAMLPRTYCYFDDIVWPAIACHNEYVGEVCAIKEYNEEHARRKICPLHLLRHQRVYPQRWNDQVYVHHDFAHPLYCRNLTPEGESERQLPL